MSAVTKHHHRWRITASDFAQIAAITLGTLSGCAVDETLTDTSLGHDVRPVPARDVPNLGADAVEPGTDATVEQDSGEVPAMDVPEARDVPSSSDRPTPPSDAPVTRPSGLPAWVVFSPVGGGVVAPVEPPPPLSQPRTVRDENIRTTIVLRTPGVYDFANVMHVWTGMGTCIQLENQPPILHIASSNVTVRNFAYRNAPDGIHIGAAVGMGQGYNAQARVENVVLDHVTGYACEDALTTQYNTWNITIENSWFHGNPNVNERDKILQLNFGNNLRIAGTTFTATPRCVRFKGGARITIESSLFDGCDDAVRGDTTMVLGLIPTTHSDVTSRSNTYRNYNRTFSAIGDITITSISDNLISGRRDLQQMGGMVVYR
jgi:hypothetical protein